MDYALHITRKKNWDGFGDEYGPDISREEWLALVRADPELRLEGCRELQTPDGQVLRDADASIAVRTRRLRHAQAGDKSGGMARCRLADGNVVIDNPDRTVRRKMWRIARALAAKVQGDDGEFYDRCGNPTSDAAHTQGYWRALCRSLVFRFIWGDPAGSDVAAFARFPVMDAIYKSSPSGTPQIIGRRLLNIIVPKNSLTAAQRTIIAAARERARMLGIDLIVTEE
jgi:hypothetical protein